MGIIARLSPADSPVLSVLTANVKLSGHVLRIIRGKKLKLGRKMALNLCLFLPKTGRKQVLCRQKSAARDSNEAVKLVGEKVL
jgi:hypothetical protein